MKYKVLLLENIDISILNIFDKDTYEVEMNNFLSRMFIKNCRSLLPLSFIFDKVDDGHQASEYS